MAKRYKEDATQRVPIRYLKMGDIAGATPSVGCK
jgi:hypothetical protein